MKPFWESNLRRILHNHRRRALTIIHHILGGDPKMPDDADLTYTLDPAVDTTAVVKADDAIDYHDAIVQDDVFELGGTGGPLTGPEAVENFRHFTDDDVYFGVGYCLKGVRTGFNVEALYASASEAWEGANFVHAAASGEHCPRAVPVYWTGGSHGYGHIAFSLGGGICRSTDWARPGYFDLAHIDDITARWGLTFEGWARDVNGVVVKRPIGTGDPDPDPPTPLPHNERLVRLRRWRDQLKARQVVAKKAGHDKAATEIGKRIIDVQRLIDHAKDN